MSNKILNLDLSKDPIMPAIVYGRVGDDRLQTVTVNLTRRDEVADLTGYKITFEGTTYNEQTKVFDSDNVSTTAAGLKKGTFDYTFPNMAFAVGGKYEQAYFSIVKDGRRDTTASFEIYVDNNADIDAPEAETIITEYNKLVAELNELQKQAIIELNRQQNQAINEMNLNFTAAQKRINELEIEISDLRNKIDQALIDFEKGNFFTKEESSANVIYQLIGKEKARVTLLFDFKDKIAGSDVENPNYGKRTTSNTSGVTSILNPSEFQTTFDNNWYESLSELDNKYNQLSAVNDGAITQELYAFNIVEILKRQLGENFFTIQGAVSIGDQVAILRNIVRASNSTIWGFGSGKSGNKLYQKLFNRFSLAWQYSHSNTASTIQPLTIPIPDNNTHAHVMDDGYIYVLAYTDSSDGVKPSALNIDSVRLELNIEVSGYEMINYLIATYHGDNIATKTEALNGKSNEKIMTPLRVADVISTLGPGGNAVASSEEALAGIENTKIMSPLRVKEALDARGIVRVTGNQNIAGNKNFTGTILKNDDPVISQNDIVTSNVFIAPFMRAGQISFMRHGSLLVVNGSATVKSAQAALTDLFVPDIGGKGPLNNAGRIVGISNKAPYAKQFILDRNGGYFRTVSALEADEFLIFSGSIMLEP